MISGQVESVRVEVVRRALIHWEGNPVTTFEVVHRTSPFSMKTWVRTDGVILRQEIAISVRDGWCWSGGVSRRRGLQSSPQPGTVGK